MYILQNIAESMLLPPGSIILLLLICLFFTLKAKKSRFLPVILMSASALFLYVISTPFCSSFLMKNLENRYAPQSINTMRIPASEVQGAISIIVVPCAGIVENSPDGIGLRPETSNRVNAAFLLYRRTGYPILLSGGNPSRNRQENAQTEAGQAASWLQAAGVSRRSLLIEGNSQNTAENAKNSIQLLLETYPRRAIRIFLVTSAYHMPRAVLSFEKFPGEIVPIPVSQKAGDSSIHLQSFLPAITSLHDSSRVLREYAGLLLYALILKNDPEE